MATDTITIHLPDHLYHRLERVAELTGQPLEGAIVRTLSSHLPPLSDDLPDNLRDALQKMERLRDDELWKLAHAAFPEEGYARLTSLREQRRDGTLDAGERAELDQLLQEADLLTLQKAYAAVLLKWRGTSTPPAVRPRCERLTRPSHVANLHPRRAQMQHNPSILGPHSGIAEWTRDGHARSLI